MYFEILKVFSLDYLFFYWVVLQVCSSHYDFFIMCFCLQSTAVNKFLALSAGNFVSNGVINTAYVKAFFVGLMDGDGSIQVNHWRRSSLQFSLIIKLKNLPENVQMLQLISSVIGGSVRFASKNGVANAYVIWVVNAVQEIKQILPIFDRYPLLTTKAKCRLAFMKSCLALVDDSTITINQRMAWYFANADKRFLHVYVNPTVNDLLALDYIKPWISGFTEAEGCFTLRSNSGGYASFSIGQNSEPSILTLFSVLFDTQNLPTLRQSRSGIPFYVFEVFAIYSLKRAVVFFDNYPLLGAKKTSFELFKQHCSTK